MADSARKFDPNENEDVHSAIRPNFRAIDGGGQGDGVPAGKIAAVPDSPDESEDSSTSSKSGRHLRAVPDGDETNLPDSEQEGIRPEKSKAERDEAKAAGVDADDETGVDDSGGWRTNVKARSQASKNTRKFFAAGTVVGGLIVSVVALIAFLLPFKLTHIIESIEQRVGQVPQYAVEQRLEYYMSRYLMIRALEETGDFDFSPGGTDRDRFTYLGSSFWNSMYTNWKGANLEKQLTTKYNMKVRAQITDPEVFRRNGKLRANQFFLDDLGVGVNSPRRTQPLDRPEVRQIIRTFAKDETKSRQVLKRFHMRRVMKKYYGVGNWKPFERKRDEVTNKYLEKKRTFKKRLVNETVGRLSERYDKYLQCLLSTSTGKECRDILKKTDYNPNAPDGNKDEDGRNKAAEKIDANTSSDGGDSDSKIAKEVTDEIQAFGLKRAMTYLAGGVGAIETLTHVYGALDSGVLNQVVYDKNAQQYLAYGATFFSAEDQIVSGEDFDIEDVRVAHEALGKYDESPVYQSGTYKGGTVSAAERIWRDCDNDESNGKETQLEEGETVCPNKRLVQDKTSFTESEGWKALGTVIFTPYKNTIGKIVSRITGAITSVVNAIGLDSIISNIASFLKLDVAAAKAFGFLLNRVAAPVISGAEVNGDAYDALHASVAVRQSAVGGEVGVSKEDTIGGAYLSDGKTAIIRDSQIKDYYDELNKKPALARYFSPSIKESLTGRLATTMPTSVTGFSSQAVATLNPMKLIGSVTNAFSAQVGAQEVIEKGQEEPQSTNPFHVLNMGFPADHEVFTANNGEGMDPEDLRKKYQCDLPVDQRPQNTTEFEGKPAFGQPDGLPFEVPLIPDPCLLEETTTESGSKYFTGKTTDADLTGGTTAGGGSSIVPGSLKCPDVMDPHPYIAGYFKMPAAPNDEYEIYSVEARRYGSRQLVCMLYTVGLAYYDFYKGESKLWIGDLNAGEPHKSHFRGIAVDVDAGGRYAAADRTRAAKGVYSKQATVDLGTAFVKTGIIYNLWWCDGGDGSLADIVAAAQANNTPLHGAKCIEGHDNHFHIDILPEYIIPGNFAP